MSRDDANLDRRALLFGRWRQSRPTPAQPVSAVAQGSAINWVRPPGAITPAMFVQSCDACGKCAQVCPAQAIKMNGPPVANRKAGPRIDATQAPCVMCDEIACVMACPTGALAPVRREAIRIAQIRFDPDRCWSATGRDAECDFCADRCPVGETAITIKVGEGPTLRDGCTGCGACVAYCPAKPPPLIQLPPRT